VAVHNRTGPHPYSIGSVGIVDGLLEEVDRLPTSESERTGDELAKVDEDEGSSALLRPNLGKPMSLPAEEDEEQAATLGDVGDGAGLALLVARQEESGTTGRIGSGSAAGGTTAPPDDCLLSVAKAAMRSARRRSSLTSSMTRSRSLSESKRVESSRSSGPWMRPRR
jgi:hypothetical protein